MERVSICLDLPHNTNLAPVHDNGKLIGFTVTAEINSLEARMGKAEFEAALKQLSR